MQDQAGLVPIMLAFLRGDEAQGRPWDTGEFGGGCLVTEALTDVNEIASYVAGAPFWTLWLD